MIEECKKSIKKLICNEIKIWYDKSEKNPDDELLKEYLEDSREDLRQFECICAENERNNKLFDLLKEVIN